MSFGWHNRWLRRKQKREFYDRRLITKLPFRNKTTRFQSPGNNEEWTTCWVCPRQRQLKSTFCISHRQYHVAITETCSIGLYAENLPMRLQAKKIYHVKIFIASSFQHRSLISVVKVIKGRLKVNINGDRWHKFLQSWPKKRNLRSLGDASDTIVCQQTAQFTFTFTLQRTLLHDENATNKSLLKMKAGNVNAMGSSSSSRQYQWQAT